MNIKKLGFALLATGAAIFSGCEADEGKGKDSSNNYVEIIAKVENGNTYNSVYKTVKAIYFDYTYSTYNEPIAHIVATGNYSNGGFTVKLPQTPDKPLAFLDVQSYEAKGIKISNRNAKGLYFGLILGYDNNGKDVGYYFVHGRVNNVNSFTRVLYYYFDRDISITGSHFDTETNFEESYDAFMTEGWNKVYVTKSISANGITRHEYTTQEPGGLKWYRNDDINVSDKSLYN